MRILSAAALLVLAGCQTVPPAPIVRTKIEKVHVYVYKPLRAELTAMPSYLQIVTNGDLWQDDIVCRGKLNQIAKLQPKETP